jgi:N utilization substance protein A
MLDIKKIDAAITMISTEKKIPKEKLVEIIEAAIKTAYKKDYGNREEEGNVKLNLKEGTIEIAIEKTVVKVVENSDLEISIDEVEWFDVWDIVEIDVTDEIMTEENSESFGRIASQAARQVIIQKIGETEKEKIYDLFKDMKGQMIAMKIDIAEGGKVLLEYKDNKIPLPRAEQVSRDDYVAWARLYLLVADVVKEENKTPRVTLSRKRPELVSEIFKEFVPEIEEWIVSIDKVVRQAWVKTKMLVSSNFPEIDPVWTLIGQKWIRVKQVMDELFGEKIDIIPNIDNAEEVIKKALSPAKVLKVIPGKDEDSVIAYIAHWERARAVWKWGLNVNLASELTGYKISIEEDKNSVKEEVEEKSEEEKEVT